MTDRETKVQELKDKMLQFVKEREWEPYHSPKNLAMSIAIEAAELMEIFQWVSAEEAWKVRETDEFEHVKEELADIMLYCCSFANQMNIDISQAIEDKMVKNAIKYPADDRTDAVKWR